MNDSTFGGRPCDNDGFYPFITQYLLQVRLIEFVDARFNNRLIAAGRYAAQDGLGFASAVVLCQDSLNSCELRARRRVTRVRVPNAKTSRTDRAAAEPRVPLSQRRHRKTESTMLSGLMSKAAMDITLKLRINTKSIPLIRAGVNRGNQMRRILVQNPAPLAIAASSKSLKKKSSDPNFLKIK